MSDISDDELKRLLKELDKLDEVPTEVAARMDATIERLAAEEKSKKSSKFTSVSWALAAGFTLVFGLGVVLNLESSPISQSPSTTFESSQKNEDDVLTSTGREPRQTNQEAPQYSSNLDYSKKLSIADFPFTPAVDYGDITNVTSELRTCLTSLGLEQSISTIDKAVYGDKKVSAIWSAITEKSWQVFLIDSNCEGVAEVFIND
jgi:cytoskeletal protein RodZ